MGFKLIKFANKQQIDYKFQANEVQSSQEERYDMIIGSDLLNELGIDGTAITVSNGKVIQFKWKI
jgi:hypothetical protein